MYKLFWEVLSGAIAPQAMLEEMEIDYEKIPVDISSAHGLLWASVAFAAAAVPGPGATPAAAQESHLLVVVGLGGDDAYRERFLGWALTLRTAAMERYGLSEERAVILAEGEPAPGQPWSPQP